MLLQNKPTGENRVNVNIKVIQRGLITARAYFIHKIVYLIVAFHVRSETKIILIDTPYASKIYCIWQERFMTNTWGG